MKVIGFIFLFVLAVVLSVATSVYIIDLKTYKGRYEIVFGSVLHTTSEPSDESGLKVLTPTVEMACFKFDTVTGETWRYVSDFYNDPNRTITTKGFEEVKEGFIYNFTQKNQTKQIDASKLPSIYDGLNNK